MSIIGNLMNLNELRVLSNGLIETDEKYKYVKYKYNNYHIETYISEFGGLEINIKNGYYGEYKNMYKGKVPSKAEEEGELVKIGNLKKYKNENIKFLIIKKIEEYRKEG